MNALAELNTVHVVIAVIENTKQEVLVSERKPNAHLGGLLEFPGGKVEANESPADALRREIAEELNIDAVSFSRLIQFPYTYSDRNILIDAYKVNKYSGEISGNEGQNIFWRSTALLHDDEFPAANAGVIRALQLPQLFPVTPDYLYDPDNFLVQFEKIISEKIIKIIQLRLHDLEDPQYMKIAKQCAVLCKKYSVDLILNRELKSIESLDVSGIHLTSKRLLETKHRPLSKKYLVGASCHNKNEIEHANKLALDYVFVGAVIEKNSSKNSKTLDWTGFADLVKDSLIPVYAIGGVNESNVNTSIFHGGQGIAAIRSFWSK